MEPVESYTTAGGVVLNRHGEMLLLERDVIRNGGVVREMRLPKGHIDPGETDAEAALREVGEESGYWQVEIIADLGFAHSSFKRDGIRYERDEHYYLMHLLKEEREAPQPVSEEEALFNPVWLPVSEAVESTTFSTEKEFVRRAQAFLASGNSR